ncbi:meiosis-specific protein MEI4 isoform X2 [Scophthalmus maximus]|uniref:meiosis-specific protein MEI4 isoform X2 n=1 Tax=Scophthalmus maximus TaxID=52904 RepID=UPI0015E0BFAE|nr:meiosis-specific protein MEI4 isoform X2 [Scophthalmus maximus]
MAGGGGQTPSDGGRVTGADEALWFLARARVAVAVAVIKSRPAGMSGREHAEALGRQLRSEDESWRGKAEGLQREVLRLRQELLIARATSVTQGATETAGPDRAVDDASQDLFDTSDAAPDCDSDTPELFLPDHQPAISLPEPDPQAAISLPRPPTPSCHYGRFPQEEALHSHVHFLQTLCALHRVEGSGSGLEALWFSPDGVGGAGESVLADSVCQLLCSVAAACRVPAPPCVCLGDLVPRACRAAARAMDLFCSQRRPSAEFTGRVEESLRELTGLLLHGDQPSEAAETLVTCLVTLGSSNMSRSFLIGHILSQLSAVADQLWQVFQEVTDESRSPDALQGLDKFPLDRYRNSCHLFQILEELLRTSPAPRRVEVGPEESGFLTQLEQRVFPLSDEFPLFSIFMWRIGGLLTSSDR